MKDSEVSGILSLGYVTGVCERYEFLKVYGGSGHRKGEEAKRQERRPFEEAASYGRRARPVRR